MKRKRRPPKPDPLIWAMGKEIKRLRNKREMSQYTLADMISCSPAYMSKIERGHTMPTDDCVFAIASALETDPLPLFLKLGRLPRYLEQQVTDQVIKGMRAGWNARSGRDSPVGLHEPYWITVELLPDSQIG